MPTESCCAGARRWRTIAHALEQERDEAREAAQQFFEATVADYADPVARFSFVSGLLQRWPWLRPNPWMPDE